MKLSQLPKIVAPLGLGWRMSGWISELTTNSDYFVCAFHLITFKLMGLPYPYHTAISDWTLS